MGLFSKGEEGLAGGSRANFIEGNGKYLVQLTSAVKRKNRKGNDQTVLTFKIIAAEKGSDLAPGAERAFRHCEAEAKYPESDNARYLGWVLALAGLRYDPNDLSVLAKGLGIDMSSFEDEEDEDVRNLKLRKEIDQRVEKLLAELEGGEGTAWAGRICEVRTVQKSPGGFTNVYASAIPSVMWEDTDSGRVLSERGRMLLARNGFEFIDAA